MFFHMFLVDFISKFFYGNFMIISSEINSSFVSMNYLNIETKVLACRYHTTKIKETNQKGRVKRIKFLDFYLAFGGSIKISFIYADPLAL